MEIVTKSAAATRALGKKIGFNLKKKVSVSKSNIVLGMIGDLGSGKTTFVQGLAEGLGVTDKIISPTFVIIRSYCQAQRQLRLHHVDLYRLGKITKMDFENLGLSDLLYKKSCSIIVIEWADKVRRFLPKNTSWIKFSVLNGEKRKIILRGLETT